MAARRWRRRVATMAHEFDMVVRGGTIADGTGSELVEGDVAIRDGKIAAVGKGLGSGREEIDARGLLVTPGFVDVHTHYDGQLSWSERLAPSSGHGVTSVVTGNCGVGFAPCREGDRDKLMRLMEGVEDIPEIVMAEGLSWDWNSFGDFLQSVEKQPHDIDFAVMLPHSPVRVFVMGERAVRLEAATEADRAQMRVIAKEAMLAGAAGFATSRSLHHQASDGGRIPSFAAEEAELTQIALGMADAGRGQIQAISTTQNPCVGDYELLHRVAREAGRPLSYTLQFAPGRREGLAEDVLDAMVRENAAGGNVKAQVFNRPSGVILALETGFHPFMGHPKFVEHLAKLPHAERVAAMRQPDVRAALLKPMGASTHPFATLLAQFNLIFPLRGASDYEPAASTSIAAVAAARGVSPYEVAYDLLMENDGRGKLMVATTNYGEGNLNSSLKMMRRDDTVLALGDGGAHYGLICDASYTTFQLAHWVRDRKGERLGLAEAVHMMTDQPARLYSFRDRGRIAPGLKADLNVIDMDRLTLHPPEVVSDLPAGGRRLTQTADGYVATLVSGRTIMRDGVDTGARPGKLVRSVGG